MRIPFEPRSPNSGFRRLVLMCGGAVCLLTVTSLFAQDAAPAQAAEKTAQSFLNVRDMLAAGGMIGYVIMFLSFIMVALIIDFAAYPSVNIYAARTCRRNTPLPG